MQTKSYRLLKWTLFMGLAASLASACVVTTGDGGGDVTIDGGEGGTKPTAGTKATGGTNAGTSSGGTSAGTATAGTGGSGTAGATMGEGGAAYVPGACQDDLSTPSMLPSCDSKPDDNDCGACLKAKCCDSLQECYGTEPTSACGYGATSDEDFGQFDCILACYKKNASQIADGLKTQAEVVTDCAGECANQCADVGDGLINQDTQALLDCAQNGEDGDMNMGTDDCNDACFPPPP